MSNVLRPSTKRNKAKESATTAAEAPKMAASKGITIDPTKPTKYPVILSDALLGQETTEAFTGVRYNHKPTLSSDSAPSTARIKASARPDGSYNMGFEDKGGKYQFNGARTSKDGKYILVFDMARKAFVLHPVDSMFHMNITRMPGNTDIESLRKEFPQLNVSGNAVSSAAAADAKEKEAPPATTSAKKETAKKDTPKKEPAQKAAAKKETAKKDAPKVAPKKKDAVFLKPTKKPAAKAAKDDKKKTTTAKQQQKEAEAAPLMLPDLTQAMPPPPPKPEAKKSKRAADSDDSDEDDDDDLLTVVYPTGTAPPASHFSPQFGTGGRTERSFSDFVRNRSRDDTNYDEDADADGEADIEFEDLMPDDEPEDDPVSHRPAHAGFTGAYSGGGTAAADVQDDVEDLEAELVKELENELDMGSESSVSEED